ncbi:MAG TPA: tRNA (guanosine(46)-N7)-methyltransferase TrmB [Crenotrichaceae bacterium]|nr:tRNA (guanosine(46)-N7)-methyltransferase TrmB [Crenotrichaceae bacterium]
MTVELQPRGLVKRHVRSFVRRDSRLTAGQQNAIDSSWDHYGLDPQDNMFDFESVFANASPVILEIGFGNGESLARMASDYPHYNFIGIETHKPGVGHLLIEVARRGLTNVRVYHADTVTILSQCIQNQSVSGVHVFFPDPWQKRRHHKRRLINIEFIQQITDKLCCGGYLFIATDWCDYAKSIQAMLLDERCLLQELNHPDQTDIAIPDRPITKFESRGLRLGHEIHEFRFFKQQ